MKHYTRSSILSVTNRGECAGFGERVCPPLARLGRPAMSAFAPLLEGKRTSIGPADFTSSTTWPKHWTLRRDQTAQSAAVFRDIARSPTILEVMDLPTSVLGA
jgi:hypothetical protein